MHINSMQHRRPASSRSQYAHKVMHKVFPVLRLLRSSEANTNNHCGAPEDSRSACLHVVHSHLVVARARGNNAVPCKRAKQNKFCRSRLEVTRKVCWRRKSKSEHSCTERSRTAAIKYLCLACSARRICLRCAQCPRHCGSAACLCPRCTHACHRCRSAAYHLVVSAHSHAASQLRYVPKQELTAEHDLSFN